MSLAPGLDRNQRAAAAATSWHPLLVRLARRRPVNFISIHYAYFILVPLICSIILWASAGPTSSIAYVDSLFLVVSAITEAGLNTVDLSNLTTWQQIILFLLILCGGSVWASIWLIVVRRRSFKRLLQSDGLYDRPPGQPAEGCARQGTLCVERGACSPNNDGIKQVSLSSMNASPADAECNPLIFLNNKTIGRNRSFVNISPEEQKLVRGVEYRALSLLSVVVPLYFALWQLLGCLGLGAWIANNRPGPALANGINPWWLGIFNGVSAFNNSGMSLLDANVVPYQTSHYVLITMGLMILAGNTAYPVLLRLILWVMFQILKALPAGPRVLTAKLTVEYILKYPRRVYTSLFPTRHTWWLACMVVLLNSVGLTAFEVLNAGNPLIEAIPPGSRHLDGLFQTIAVRAGGFYVVPIADLHIGVLILYLIMMYISAFPVILTARHSNIHEAKYRGHFPHDASSSDIEGLIIRDSPNHFDFQSASLFISQQVKGQLAHDMWLLAMAVFIITTIEASNFSRDPVSYSVFNIMFEVVSAYGCVGLSVGLPNKNYSFSGGWHSASKLILCLVMIRGRHRDLPASTDYAVCLPGKHEELGKEDGHRANSRTDGKRRGLQCAKLS
ncbi:hypothetical protein E4U43_000735 [Claviceps pusilla]|uniref:Cation transporter n=1 Tax=Claviceps pusilla TaxID=123648 RepID=A0A9P7NB19_9HYPO|nr:hypothetical protein E4U43_000735 [Claviceps pusilla]